MASGVYSSFKGNLMKKQVNLDSGGDTIKVALYNNSHTFTATDTTYTTTYELAAAGNYSQGGATLASPVGYSRSDN